MPLTWAEMMMAREIAAAREAASAALEQPTWQEAAEEANDTYVMEVPTVQEVMDNASDHRLSQLEGIMEAVVGPIGEAGGLYEEAVVVSEDSPSTSTHEVNRRYRFCQRCYEYMPDGNEFYNYCPAQYPDSQPCEGGPLPPIPGEPINTSELTRQELRILLFERVMGEGRAYTPWDGEGGWPVAPIAMEAYYLAVVYGLYEREAINCARTFLIGRQRGNWNVSRNWGNVTLFLSSVPFPERLPRWTEGYEPRLRIPDDLGKSSPYRRDATDAVAALTEVLDEFRIIFLNPRSDTEMLSMTAMEAAQSMRRALSAVRKALREMKAAGEDERSASGEAGVSVGFPS